MRSNLPTEAAPAPVAGAPQRKPSPPVATKPRQPKPAPRAGPPSASRQQESASRSSPLEQQLGLTNTASDPMVSPQVPPPAGSPLDSLHPQVASPPQPAAVDGEPPGLIPRLPPGHTPLEELQATLLFEKVMTTCDANGAGRIVIPKNAAMNSLPTLDDSNHYNMTLHVTDTAGARHELAYRSWANGKGRMYLLEGVQKLQAKYCIGIGDVLVFSELPDKSVCISGRPARPGDVSRKAPRNSTGAHRLKKAPHVRISIMGKRRRTDGSWADSDESDAASEASFFDPLQDGVFRAVPAGPRGGRARSGPPRVTEVHGVWTAIIDLAGEAYQAFFKNKDTAEESFNVATQHLA